MGILSKILLNTYRERRTVMKLKLLLSSLAKVTKERINQKLISQLQVYINGLKDYLMLSVYCLPDRL